MQNNEPCCWKRTDRAHQNRQARHSLQHNACSATADIGTQAIHKQQTWPCKGFLLWTRQLLGNKPASVLQFETAVPR